MTQEELLAFSIYPWLKESSYQPSFELVMCYDNAKGSVLRDFKERFKDAKQNQNNAEYSFDTQLKAALTMKRAVV